MSKQRWIALRAEILRPWRSQRMKKKIVANFSRRCRCLGAGLVAWAKGRLGRNAAECRRHGQLGAVYLQAHRKWGPAWDDAPGQRVQCPVSSKRISKRILIGFRDRRLDSYLVVKYQLTKEGSDERCAAILYADGGRLTAPHYGDNEPMGPGRQLVLRSAERRRPRPFWPPCRQGDRRRSVLDFDAWSYEFTYAGTGKKGAY